MKFVMILGLLITFTVIAVIDHPNLAAQTHRQKFTAVYYTVLILGFVLSVLNVFNVVPDYFKVMIDIYKKLFMQR